MSSAGTSSPGSSSPGSGTNTSTRTGTAADTEAREAALLDTFVDLSKGLVSAGDLAELLQQLVDRAVGLLSATSAGLILADERGELSVLASSSDDQDVLELFQLQVQEGPCVECAHTGRAVLVDDLTRNPDRWPRWGPVALDRGARSTYALPMRLDDRVFGALNLFGDRTHLLAARDRRVGQALADVATVAVLTSRQIRRAESLTSQLQTALDSGVVIEQAKGVVAARLGVSVDRAFQVLRNHSRSTNRRLTEVAGEVTTGRLDASALAVPGHR